MRPPLSYLPPSAQARDESHLNILSICHYVWGGLALLFSLIFIIYIILGVQILRDPASMGFGPGPVVGGGSAIGGTLNGARLATTVGSWMVAMGSGLLALGWAVGLLNIFSGLSIARRRRRGLSLVVAGVNCALLPLGTVLGVFGFVVLLRPGARSAYAAARERTEWLSRLLLDS